MADVTFEPGEKATWIVGLPGPDLDDCEVVCVLPDGTYKVRLQVFGSGPWHEGVATPGLRKIGGLFKRKEASK